MGTRPRKFFYGWWVVLTAATGLLLGYAPIFVFSFGVFVKSLVNEFHSSRTQISLAFTLANVMFSVSSPLAGRLVDRFGARRVILPGTLIFGFLLISFKFISTSLWQLYVISSRWVSSAVPPRCLTLKSSLIGLTNGEAWLWVSPWRGWPPEPS
jgi:MFS family permease